MAIVGKSAPWHTYYHELEALFGSDPEIEMAMGSEREPGKEIIVITAKTNKKANAIRKIVPVSKSFGSIQVTVRVESKENDVKASPENMLKDAFENNPVVKRIFSTNPDAMTVPQGVFVEFANRVVQFFDDRLDDPHGNVSTLYQNIAKDVLTPGLGVMFCTAGPEKAAVEKPAVKKTKDSNAELDEMIKIFDSIFNPKEKK